MAHHLEADADERRGPIRLLLLPQAGGGGLMSILTMTPSPEWYEAPDIEDEGDDTVPIPELLTANCWSASSVLDTED